MFPPNTDATLGAAGAEKDKQTLYYQIKYFLHDPMVGIKLTLNCNHVVRSSNHSTAKSKFCLLESGHFGSVNVPSTA